MERCNLGLSRVSRPTLRHIADKLGVSTATVSLAMRDNERISLNTRKRVKAALAEHGYVYARSAASLRTARTHTVGVILNNVSDPFFGALLASLEEALAKSGRTVFLCNTNESCERQAQFIRTMAEYNADGIIVCPAIGSTVEDFRPPHVPVPPLVFVSRALFRSEFDYVVSDDREAGRLATERLVGLGHRRIAVVGGDPSTSPFDQRLLGYRGALEAATIAFDDSLVRRSAPSRAEGFRAAGWIAGLTPRPTAAICCNDSTALGLFHGLTKEGLFPGRNFALIGHEDVEETSLVDPPMSVTRVAREEMGRRAAAALIERIDDPHAPPHRTVLKTELVVRGTCGVTPTAS